MPVALPPGCSIVLANPLPTKPGPVTITGGIAGLAVRAASAAGSAWTTTNSRSMRARSAAAFVLRASITRFRPSMPRGTLKTGQWGTPKNRPTKRAPNSRRIEF